MGETHELYPLAEAVKSACGEYARSSGTGFIAVEMDGVVLVAAKTPNGKDILRRLVSRWGGALQVPQQAGPTPEDAEAPEGTGS